MIDNSMRALILIFAILFAGSAPSTGTVEVKTLPEILLEDRLPMISYMLKQTAPQVTLNSVNAPPMVSNGPLVEGEYRDIPLQEALVTLSKETGIPIMAVGDVQGVVNMDLRGVPLDTALAMLTIPNGCDFLSLDGGYLVGDVNKENPGIHVLKAYRPSFLSAERLMNMLSHSYIDYLTCHDGILVISAPPTMVKRIEDDMLTLDRPGRQIGVEVKILRVPVNTSRELGLQWLEEHGSNGDLSEAIDAILEEKGGWISVRTWVNAMEGEETHIWLNKELPFTEIEVDTDVYEDVSPYIKTGLSFKGHITETGEIVFSVAPQIMRIDTRDETLLMVDSVNISTQARLRDGESLILGGMLEEEQERKILEVPLLSQVPFLGALFKWDKMLYRDVETLIVITPRIIE